MTLTHFLTHPVVIPWRNASNAPFPPYTQTLGLLAYAQLSNPIHVSFYRTSFDKCLSLFLELSLVLGTGDPRIKKIRIMSHGAYILVVNLKCKSLIIAYIFHIILVHLYGNAVAKYIL